jgi:hypothetical protein
MDWSRCCNSLTQYEDGVYQVGVFERILRKHHYYSTEYEGPARATICTWEDTEAWLKEVASKEHVEQPKIAVENPKMEDTEGSAKKDATNHSTPPQPPQLSTTEVKGTAQAPHAGEENAAALSPKSPNTFPSAAVTKVGNKSPGHARKSNTEVVPPKKKLSLPQMLKFFHKKPSKPPEPVIKKED